MKKFLSILALIVTLDGYSQISFNKLESYGNPAISATNIERIGDNYFVQYLFIDSSHIQGVGVLKTDKYGNVIKKIEFKDTAFWYGSFSFSNFIATSDSFLIMAANRFYNQQLKKEEVEIWKFDINLDTVWTKLINHPDTAQANLPGAETLMRVKDIVEALDGGYVLSISYNRQCLDPSVFSNRRALLIKLDTSGSSVWINRNSEYYKDLISLDITSDSGFIVPTIRGNTGLPYNLNKFDKNGNYQWKVDANAYSTQTHAIACCEYDSASAIMATYYKIDIQSGKYGITVFKINTITKSVEWNKDFIVSEDMASQINLSNSPMEIRVKSGKVFIATSGRHLYFTPPPWVYSYHIYSGIVLKLNSHGDSLKTYYLNYDKNGGCDMELEGFMVLDDGSFAGTGYGLSYANHRQMLWLFRTTATGYLNIENQKAVNGFKLSVFPNPATGKLNFTFDKNIQSRIVLTIYNSIGQKIGNYTITGGQTGFNINIHDYKSGIYFYRFTDKNNIQIAFGKFIRE